MRDKSHLQQVERWAEFCRSHPYEWKMVQKEFINAQFAMSERFFKKMLESPQGKERLEELRKNKLLIESRENTTSGQRL